LSKLPNESKKAELPKKHSSKDQPVKDQSVKRYVITAIKFAVSIGILIYLFRSARASDPELFDGFMTREKNWSWIGIGFVSCFAAHMFSFFRWRVLVRALDLPFTLFDAVRIGFISAFFSLFAFGVIGGDTLRAFYVTRQVRDRAPEAICSVVADRVIGLMTMFSFASIAFLMIDMTGIAQENPAKFATLNFVCRVVQGVTAAGFAGAMTLFLAPQIVRTNWYQKLCKIPKTGPILQRLTAVALVYRSKPLAVLFCFLMSVGVNVCFVISIYSMARGMTEIYPTLADHFLIEPIAMVANAIPLPGGVGGMEFAMKLLYETFNHRGGVLVAFAFRFALLCVSAMGAAFWFMNRSKVADVIENSPETE